MAAAMSRKVVVQAALMLFAVPEAGAVTLQEGNSGNLLKGLGKKLSNVFTPGHRGASLFSREQTAEERAAALTASTIGKAEEKTEETKTVKKKKKKSVLHLPTLFPAKPTKAPGWPLGPCRAPKPGEKIVYFVQAADAPFESDGEKDAMLYEDSAQEVPKLRKDPRFAKALHGNVSERADLVVVSPMRSAMETAILAFGDLLKDVKWEVDPRVRGIKKDGDYDKTKGSAMLMDMGREDLVQEYLNKYDEHVHGGHGNRWIHWIEDLRKRNESRIILVTHAFQCEMTGMAIQPGEVRIAALKLDPPDSDRNGGNAWRQLSKPTCWDLPQNDTDATATPAADRL